jgi:hypothetical protein
LTRATRNATRKPPVTKSASQKTPVTKSKGYNLLSDRTRRNFVRDLEKPRKTGGDEAQRRLKDKQYRRKLYTDWLSKWASNDRQLLDVYLNKAQAFDHNGFELVDGVAVKTHDAQAFQLSTDALDPNFVDGDIFFNHAPANIVPVSLFLNNLRYYFAAVIIPLWAELCHGRLIWMMS